MGYGIVAMGTKEGRAVGVGAARRCRRGECTGRQPSFRNFRVHFYSKQFGEYTDSLEVRRCSRRASLDLTRQRPKPTDALRVQGRRSASLPDVHVPPPPSYERTLYLKQSLDTGGRCTRSVSAKTLPGEARSPWEWATWRLNANCCLSSGDHAGGYSTCEPGGRARRTNTLALEGNVASRDTTHDGSMAGHIICARALVATDRGCGAEI